MTTRYEAASTGLIVATAGAVGVVGSLGPWARIHNALDANGTLYGTHGGVDLDGILTAVLMGTTLVIGLLLVTVPSWRRWWRVLALVPALFSGLTAWLDGTDIAAGDGSMAASQVDAEWGVWLVGIAAGVAVLGVLADAARTTLQRPRRARVA